MQYISLKCKFEQYFYFKGELLPAFFDSDIESVSNMNELEHLHHKLISNYEMLSKALSKFLETIRRLKGKMSYQRKWRVTSDFRVYVETDPDNLSHWLHTYQDVIYEGTMFHCHHSLLYNQKDVCGAICSSRYGFCLKACFLRASGRCADHDNQSKD